MRGYSGKPAQRVRASVQTGGDGNSLSGKKELPIDRVTHGERTGKLHNHRTGTSNWVGSLHQGHLIQPKAENCVRVYTQRINGLPVAAPDDHLHHFLQAMQGRQVDIMGVAETNVEWRDYKLNTTLYRVVRQHCPGGSWITMTSGILAETTYKPGGKLLVMNNQTWSRIMGQRTDNKGQWVWMQIHQPILPLMIVQLYIPPTSGGINLAYAQQYNQLQQETRFPTPDVMGT